MRNRSLLLAACSVFTVSMAAAGCGAGAGQVAGGHATAATGGTTSAAATSPAAPSAAASPTSGAAGGTSSGTACSATPASTGPAQGLTGLQFVSAEQGWAVGAGLILATSDGGAHWTTQLHGGPNLNSVDFVNGRDGWAVGATALLATTDGGAHWARLPEPCPVITSVHFISPAQGYAVADGKSNGTATAPASGGVVLATSDGGRTWHRLTAPANAQTVCFSDARHGWLGAGGLLYRTSDGGDTWTTLTSMSGQVGSGGSQYLAVMQVECASGGTAWAVRSGPGAAMSQQAHVGFHADQAGATALFAEHYFQTPGTGPSAESPGSTAGPFSAISPTSAAFVDFCSACGVGTAPWDLATKSGAVLTKKGNVGSITMPQAASFLSGNVGWVAGQETVYSKSGGTSRSQERIVATTDGGHSWHIQYAGPWTNP